MSFSSAIISRRLSASSRSAFAAAQRSTGTNHWKATAATATTTQVRTITDHMRERKESDDNIIADVS